MRISDWSSDVCSSDLPNVYAADGGRALYDYATEAAIWLPCALADARFDDTPMARGATRQPPPAWSLRCASLRAQGKLQGNTLAEQAAQAHHYLQQRGWNDAAMATAASTTAFDLWRVVTAGYASAYLRRSTADQIGRANVRPPRHTAPPLCSLL